MEFGEGFDEEVGSGLRVEVEKNGELLNYGKGCEFAMVKVLVMEFGEGIEERKKTEFERGKENL